MIGLAASFALLITAPAQETCASHDTACRLRQLEYRVAMLEQRLAQQPRSGIEMSVSFTCSNRAECARRAAEACAEGGFTRGAPVEIRQLYSFYTVERVACAG